jgi:hypothetical protein
MSRGEFNKFGYWGYVRAIIDGRGMNFCDECIHFLKQFQPIRHPLAGMMKDKFYLH